MITANGSTGWKDRYPVTHRIQQQVAVPLREMQYENCSFEIDVLQCPRCQGRLRILVTIHPPDATRTILEWLGLPSLAPPLAPAAGADTIPFQWA